MTSVDKAFIKAYRQHGSAPASAGEATRAVSLAEALEERPRPAPEARSANLDVVIAALARSQGRLADPPAPGQALATPPGEKTDPVGKSTSVHAVPAFLRIRPPQRRKQPTRPTVVLEDWGVPAELPPEETPPAAVPVATDASAPAETDSVAAAEPCGARAAEATPFSPMLQVDRFNWPKTCRRLSAAAPGQIDRLSDAMAAAAQRGQKVLAMAGCRRGEGVTSLLLCAARQLAGRGLRAVLADANLADPQIARRLGLLPECGWEDVLAGRIPLEEAVIESAENLSAVLPVREPVSSLGDPQQAETRMVETLDALAAHYDLVLVDLGPLEDPAAVGGSLGRGLARRLGAAVLVHNVRRTTPERLDEVQQCWRATGIEQLGIVQNFVGT